MASRTLPGIGLTGFWSLGEDNWKDANDTNLLRTSVLTQGRALTFTSTTPGAPTNGDIHLFSETHATQANKVAVYDNGAWVYLTPSTGWQFYDVATGAMRRFNGTLWELRIDAFQIALSDMATAITTGTEKAGWVVPFNCKIAQVFCTLVGAQSSLGSVTIDAKISATSIFSTLPTIDASEDSSLTGTAAVLSTTSLTKGQIIKFDITAAGTGAKGLIVTVMVYR